MIQKLLRTRLVSFVVRQALESGEKRVWTMTSSGAPYGYRNFVSSDERAGVIVEWCLESTHDADLIRRLQVFHTTIKGATVVAFVDSIEDRKQLRFSWIRYLGFQPAPTTATKTKVIVAPKMAEQMFREPIVEARERYLQLAETGKWVYTAPFSKSEPVYKRILAKVTEVATLAFR